MTVINKLNQTLEMLKACESSCKTFSMDTDDLNAKQMYTQMAGTIKQATDMLQSRVDFVMSEEPQYQPQSQQSQQQQQLTNQMQNQTQTQTISAEQAKPLDDEDHLDL